MTQPTCGDCKHSRPLIFNGKTIETDVLCQRFPPQLSVQMTFIYPNMRISDPTVTCGEFSARMIDVKRTARLTQVNKKR